MTWRHVSDCGTPDDDPFCGCTTPTPDPASPCGHEREDDGAPCGFRRSMGGHEFVDADHAHVPTRCLTCGHPIEPTPGGTR